MRKPNSSSSDVISEQLHLTVHAEDTVHGHFLVIVANWSIFLGRTIVELVRLHAHMSRLLQLHFQQRRVVHSLVHLILLAVTMHGSRTLSHLAVLVGQELLLVVQRVTNVRVVVALVLHHLVQEVLVVDLGARRVDLGLVRRILLEHLFAMLDIANNLFRHEDRDCSLVYIKL